MQNTIIWAIKNTIVPVALGYAAAQAVWTGSAMIGRAYYAAKSPSKKD